MNDRKDPTQTAIDDLVAQADKATAEFARVEALRKVYPDLRVSQGRWDRFWCSASVNGMVDKCDEKLSCGCCNDASVLIYPYMETEHGRIYSDPPSFIVGESNDHRPHSGWQDGMRKHGIPETIIAQTKALFQGKLEERRRELEEELAGLDSEISGESEPII